MREREKSGGRRWSEGKSCGYTCNIIVRRLVYIILKGNAFISPQLCLQPSDNIWIRLQCIIHVSILFVFDLHPLLILNRQKEREQVGCCGRLSAS